jgi:hypothetical protein
MPTHIRLFCKGLLLAWDTANINIYGCKKCHNIGPLDLTLKERYPKVDQGYRFLNSGGFIGYAADLYGIVTEVEVADTDDDQVPIL